jgi:acylphosphatase
MAIERRRYVVCGRVQGVGFRSFARDEARHLGLVGYVRNLPDGRTLEAVAQGEPSVLDSFAEALRDGPPNAFVIEMTFFVIPPVPTATTFDVAD